MTFINPSVPANDRRIGDMATRLNIVKGQDFATQAYVRRTYVTIHNTQYVYAHSISYSPWTKEVVDFIL